MPVGRALFGGSPYLGVHLRVTDSAAIVPPSTPAALEHEIERLLGVKAYRTTVCDSELVGPLLAINSNGAVVGDTIDVLERAVLERIVPVVVIRARQNALGNNLLANDHGALAHPELSDVAIGKIAGALGVPVHRGTLGGLGTVGMAGLATNRGVVVHPKATEHEVAFAGEVLGVPVHRSTANFGVPVVGACAIANSRGFITGRPTTPVEISHLQEGLSIFD
ncbi:MAG TPA: translation initiation factor IF-6 [Thermoplasmata archaeon]|nr:translation initiation factor IF-6 [Thermoplasmata archaeon]